MPSQACQRSQRSPKWAAWSCTSVPNIGPYVQGENVMISPG
jgi:hypothetical protein